MANTIKFKRASGSDPSASDLAIGEPGLRTDTAELFFKKDDGTVAKVSGGGGGPNFKYLELRNAANNGAASFPGNDFTLVTAGTTTAISPSAANTLLVSVSGVIQKPNAGTSTSGITGFIIDGSRFKTATNLPAAPDFIVFQESGGIGEPSDNTVTSAKIVDGAIVNADINASAAIAGTKISPDFGSQTVTTTGTVNTGLINASSASDQILNLNSSDNGAVYLAFKRSGSRKAYLGYGGTGNTLSLVNEISDGDINIAGTDGGSLINVLNFNVSENGRATFIGEVNVGAGIDVTGAITGTGDLTIDTNTLHVNSSNNRVGIGTTNPSYLLDVVGASGDANLRVKTLGTGSSDDTVIRGLIGGTTGSNFIFFGDADDSNVGQIRYRHSDDSLQFTTNASERMRIDSSGRVGIGTTSPSYPLDVSTSSGKSSLQIITSGTGQNDDVFLRMRTGGNIQDCFIDFGDSDDNDAGFIRYNHSNDFMSFSTNDGTEKVRIDSSGHLLFNGNGIVSVQSNSDSLFLGGGSVQPSETYLESGTFTGFKVNGSERMRIDSSGRVGIGTTSLAAKVHANSSANTATFLAEGEVDNPQYPSYGFAGQNADNGSRGAGMYLPGDNTLAFSTAGVERIRIDSTGGLRVGHTSNIFNSATHEKFSVKNSSQGNAATFQSTNTSGGFPILYVSTTDTTASQNAILFQRTGGSVGSITTSASSTAFNTSSDYRLKENEVAISDGITRLKTLKPYRFNWKVDKSTTVDGFFAHEVTAVPEAVTGFKDEVAIDDDGAIPKGDPIYQTIDHSKLVPLLVAALQEAIGRIESLEAK